MTGLMNRAPASHDKIRMSRCVLAAMRMAVRGVIASMAVIVIAGAAAPQAPPTGAAKRADCATTFEAEVEVNIYSGVRNPRFPLRGEDARILWTLLSRPMEKVFAYRMPPDLGFRGYDVTFTCPSRISATIWGEVIFLGGRMRSESAVLDPQRAMHRIISAHYPIDPRDVIQRDPPRAP
jgi:hypothetical protein